MTLNDHNFLLLISIKKNNHVSENSMKTTLEWNRYFHKKIYRQSKGKDLFSMIHNSYFTIKISVKQDSGTKLVLKL